MRKIQYSLVAVMLLVGCSRQQAEPEQELPPVEMQQAEPKQKLPSLEITHTGCNLETKAEAPSELTLQYTPQGLSIVRTNAWLNCSIRDGGISCEATLEGSTLCYKVWETQGPITNCICPVERMSSVIPGLKEDTEYYLEYRLSAKTYSTINFRYHKGLNLTVDLSLYE
jgi:hypothetical protein